ncbi:squalene/phytoene synthase family protein [Nonomuraea sp. B19D2]|uniref:squalene/phytoene synthase family protein n=1 Tax=Nonomuraea sp. B19D2 TaxID=3159561 RepID=UPI0032D9CE22
MGENTQAAVAAMMFARAAGLLRRHGCASALGGRGVADVDEAYRHCAQIMRGQARNFSYGLRLLPAPKRRALSAVYALARRLSLTAREKSVVAARALSQSHHPGDGDGEHDMPPARRNHPRQQQSL